MARTGRKVTTASLETKIDKQKEIMAKSKAKYEADKAECFYRFLLGFGPLNVGK